MGLFKTAKIGPTISLLVLGNFEVLKCYKNGLYSNFLTLMPQISGCCRISSFHNLISKQIETIFTTLSLVSLLVLLPESLSSGGSWT